MGEHAIAQLWMLALTDEFWQDARVHVGSEPQVQISEKHETEHKDRIEQIHSANRKTQRNSEFRKWSKLKWFHRLRSTWSASAVTFLPCLLCWIFGFSWLDAAAEPWSEFPEQTATISETKRLERKKESSTNQFPIMMWFRFTRCSRSSSYSDSCQQTKLSSLKRRIEPPDIENPNWKQSGNKDQKRVVNRQWLEFSSRLALDLLLLGSFAQWRFSCELILHCQRNSQIKATTN